MRYIFLIACMIGLIILSGKEIINIFEFLFFVFVMGIGYVLDIWCEKKRRRCLRNKDD